MVSRILQGTDLYSDLFPAYVGPMRTIPLTEAKTRLNELVDEAVSTHERVTITKHGRPAVVLISVDDLEAIEETLYWQAQAGVRDDLETSREEAAADELWDEEAVRERYGVNRGDH